MLPSSKADEQDTPTFPHRHLIAAFTLRGFGEGFTDFQVRFGPWVSTPLMTISPFPMQRTSVTPAARPNHVMLILVIYKQEKAFVNASAVQLQR